MYYELGANLLQKAWYSGIRHCLGSGEGSLMRKSAKNGAAIKSMPLTASL